jgi:branched-chain amino acid transport system permease protein
MADFLQYLTAGVTVGAVYALVALGFTIIYNASDVVNFAQGEFVMLGGMTTFFLAKAGLPLPLAALLAIFVTTLIGLLVYGAAMEKPAAAGLLAFFPVTIGLWGLGLPVALAVATGILGAVAAGALAARFGGHVGAQSTVGIIIVTIGVSILIRGVAQNVFDKSIHRFAGFSGEHTLEILGARVNSQSIWVIGGALVILALLWAFFNRTLVGKAVAATAANRLAARLVGIDTRKVIALCFAVSAAVGAVGGILITPLNFTTYDGGIVLALKGFAAAMLGGMGHPAGAVLGGLVLGGLESFGAGYLSSSYKDAIAFVVILLVLFVKPNGLLGRPGVERV